jgi:glucosamine 6-phosphate synthetase-like amidotransferase/phosphosugar isomerase protein
MASSWRYPGDKAIEQLSGHIIRIPEMADPLLPILMVIPLQLLAYHIIIARMRCRSAAKPGQNVTVNAVNGLRFTIDA